MAESEKPTATTTAPRATAAATATTASPKTEAPAAPTASDIAKALQALSAETAKVQAAVRVSEEKKAIALDLIAKYKLTPEGKEPAVSLDDGFLMTGGTLGYRFVPSKKG